LILFSNFEVIPTGSVTESDLPNILIASTTAGFGFELVGPLAANNGEIGDLLVRFDVDAEISIIAAHLSFNGSAFGVGAGTTVTETFEGIGDRQAFVFAIGTDGDAVVDLIDDVFFDSGLLHLRVTKDILLDSTTISGGPGTADISEITQTFTLIPEPQTGLLVLLGLGGALLLRRRHSGTQLS
jgi:hypothetical protein